MTDKEKILKLLRASISDNPPQVAVPEIQDKIYVDAGDPVVHLAEKVSAEGGKFFYCQNEEELISNLKNLIEYRKWTNIESFSKSLWAYLSSNDIPTLQSHTNAKVGISLCQGIVARTGSIILTSVQGVGNNLLHFPPIFIVIATTNQIFNTYKQIINHLSQTPPEWIMGIRSGKLISEEIKELYLFVTEP
ncbi:MAG: LUD domain-containing protein [Bacteroidota bacterium]|nr:LUD domain-containing protein [Bacteroidota bacterium]